MWISGCFFCFREDLTSKSTAANVRHVPFTSTDCSARPRWKLIALSFSFGLSGVLKLGNGEGDFPQGERLD